MRVPGSVSANESTMKITGSGVKREQNRSAHELAEQCAETAGGRRLVRQIAEMLDECRLSHAVHARKLKELTAIRSSPHTNCFFQSFAQAIRTLFDISRRTSSSERAVRFIAAFAARRDSKNAVACDAFLADFLRFLLIGACAAHRAARLRSCHIISEIIMRLPDDADVSDEVWDEVIDCMKNRLEDKVPTIRCFAVRALSRFASDAENSDIVELFLKNLSLEQNADVRKLIVLSLPPSNATSSSIVNSTGDVNELVRKAAYCVLGSKFPLRSLSIKHRTAVLQRGLSDRSPQVMKECYKMLTEEWLTKCCNKDPLVLLRYLDVETYESVGEAVMDALLKGGMVHAKAGQSIRQHLSKSEGNEGNCNSSIQLMEAEASLYWRTLCRHLHCEAQVKGSDAANTTGAEAVFYASEASVKNDLLDTLLPETTSDYVDLVKAHLSAGSAYRFVTRQLLLLGAILDFSDIANRKIAGSLVRHLLLLGPLDGDAIDDGVSLGGDRRWASAVAGLARRVHASAGEFEATVSSILKELAQPCRERAADPPQWMHCLTVASLLLENAPSLLHQAEMLHSLLLPAARQTRCSEVQRAAARCLCLYGLLETKPSPDTVSQLRLLLVSGPRRVRSMACKALVDLAMWHGPEEVDAAAGIVDMGLTHLLLSAAVNHPSDDDDDEQEENSPVCAIGEGLAKFLLWSGKYPASIPSSLQLLLLRRLIGLYFSDEIKEKPKLAQCLSVFFEHYPGLAPHHKGCVSRVFIPVMREMWPGVYGNPAGASSVAVFRKRKVAVQASRFMLQMMQAPILLLSKHLPPKLGIDCREEGLAIRIAAEVVSFQEKKTSAAKSYTAALCRVAALIRFQSEEADGIKCMRGLMHGLMTAASHDKELLSELNLMAANLHSLDAHPDGEFPPDRLRAVFEALELDESAAALRLPGQMTPVQASSRAGASRRRARREASSSDEDEGDDLAFEASFTHSVVASVRSQRASKTAAMSRMSARPCLEEEDEENDDRSSLTSDGQSDEDSYGSAE